MCQIWCVIYKLDLHTSTLLCCFRMSDNAKMPTYLILFEVHTFGWDVASMHGWVCYDMSVSICFHACVRETELICDIYMCVRDKRNSKCQREWQCTQLPMLLCVSFWQSPSAPRHCLHSAVKMSSWLLAVSWHFNTIRKSDQRGTGTLTCQILDMHYITQVIYLQHFLFTQTKFLRYEQLDGT